MQSFWPIEEAKKLLPKARSGKTIVFETGYGPSGLPHIGTFAEVVRTTMVIRALKNLYPDAKTKLICFSDDLDGLRKIPENVPNPESLKEYIGFALTSIPDPFGACKSYGDYMNSKLQEFLDLFKFEYEFKSATKCYQSGIFDKCLLGILQNYEDVKNAIVPTLGPDRAKTYSPFMPVKDGRVLQVEIVEVLKDKNLIIYKDHKTNKLQETEVTGGKCKLQWKPDWGMRWAALGVDFELHGKDLTPSAVLSSKICKILGAPLPSLSVYELFLDHEGKKISKSKGNGLSIEEWLRYAPCQTLAYFMFQNPKRAKRLYFDVIPKNVDDYLKDLSCYKKGEFKSSIDFIQDEQNEKLCNLNFSLLLNLASACNPENVDVLWGFIKKYDPNITKEDNKFLYQLAQHALNYYKDFVKPTKSYRSPNKEETDALNALAKQLSMQNYQALAEDLQQLVYDIGKQSGYKDKIGNWFKAMYQILFGQDKGPRIGSFIKLYGIENTIKMIDSAIKNKSD